MSPNPPLPADDAGWLVVEEAFEPRRQHAAETVFTVGNGRLGTRGSFEEGHPGDRPATLVHGIFAPHPLVFTELANLPDWTALEVVIEGERFSLDVGEVLAYRRVLDLRIGLLRRDVRWRSPGGRTTEIVFERFASRADPRLAAVRATVKPLDFAGMVEVRAGLNARPETDGMAHVVWCEQSVDQATACLGVSLRGTATTVGLAARLIVRGSDGEPPASVAQEAWDVRENPTLRATWAAAAGESATVEKTVVLVTSRDAAAPLDVARAHLKAQADRDFDELLAASSAARADLWAYSDVVIEGDPEAQLAIRFSIYHLLIAAPGDDDQVSIGAKTLSGFGYRGHVFWDTESFMLPFFIHVQPDIARNLLLYRYHRLPGARRKAALSGLDGAQFPWESADTGDEVTPTWLPDMSSHQRLIRIWTGDIEIHISAVIAHAVMRYWKATGDDAFMRDHGAEIVIDSARFWASRAEWNEAAGRFEYSDVIGPDEYHDHVDNNAFTNYMAEWHLRTAIEIAGWLGREHPARQAELLGSETEMAATLDRLRHVADRIYLPRDPATGLVEQFSGYFGLRDVDLDAYAARSHSMQHILGIEGVAETQVIKQPDVLMLAQMLPEVLNGPDLAANYAYYSPRTDHTYGSSLGPPIQALMAARMGQPDEAYEHFIRGCRADIADVRGNAGDGIHAANAGALWQAVVFGFAGVAFDGERVTTDPQLPAHWRRLAFSLRHRGKRVDIELRGDEVARAHAGIHGLIFDLDGVITDTAEYHYQAWQRLADEEQLPFDRQANEALRGISRRESLARILGSRVVSDEDAEEMMARKNGYYRELIATLTPADLLPGAEEILEAARERGLRLAIGSASKNAPEVLERLGIADRFDAVCDGNTVTRPKPAPDLFLAAARAIEVPAAACVVFEDAADGIAAGRAAGMRTVGIGPVERVGAADVTLTDGLRDVDLEDLLATLSATDGAAPA